ncbi:MAG: lipid-A-disaccharide synthase [Bacteroidales bacterium]|nr:lipid-A-disaccharide synthase [Bacteroidales bacterium]
MKYYLIAGEASGDMHASHLMAAIHGLDPESRFRCWGGDQMERQGGSLVVHYRELAFMGFTEVLMNIRTISRLLKQCRKDILSWRPDALILVDYPGFNLRIARFAHKTGLKVFYYISPQVWAWKKSRVFQVRDHVDRMLVILPFEKDFYARYGVEVDFVGHPLLDVLDGLDPSGRSRFRKENELDDRPVIALLPGSRPQEIRKMLPEMISVIPDFDGYQFVIGGAPSIPPGFYHRMTGNRDVRLVSGQTYPLLQNAEAAVVTSGTATLETALFEVPEVVCYRGNPVSYRIARRLVNVPYISLVNLIMERPVVTELIQDRMNAGNISRELHRLTGDEEYRKEMTEAFRSLKERLGGAGASGKAAAIIMKHLQKW